MVKCVLCGKSESIREVRFKKRIVKGKLEWVHFDCIMEGILNPNPNQMKSCLNCEFEENDDGIQCTKLTEMLEGTDYHLDHEGILLENIAKCCERYKESQTEEIEKAGVD